MFHRFVDRYVIMERVGLSELSDRRPELSNSDRGRISPYYSDFSDRAPDLTVTVSWDDLRERDAVSCLLLVVCHTKYVNEIVLP